MKTDILKFSINDTEVKPHYKNLRKVLKRDNDNMFFRESLEGNISLFGADFSLVYNAHLETSFNFKIEKLNNGVFQTYFLGEFTKSECQFDISKMKCELKINPKDQYTSILNAVEKEYNLIELAPAITPVNITKRPLVQVYVSGSEILSNYLGGTYFESEVEPVFNDNELKTKHFFSFIKNINDVTISSSDNLLINGIYIGTEGVLTNEGSTYMLYVVTEIEQQTQDTLIRKYYKLKRTSDNIDLYKSEMIYFESKNGSSYPIAGVTEKYINGNLTFNSLTTGLPFTITETTVNNIYQRLLCDVPSINGTPTNNIDPEDITGSVSNYKKVIGLQNNNIIITTQTSAQPTQYGKAANGRYFTDNFLPSTAGIGKLLPVSRNSWLNASIWFYTDYTYETLIEPNARKKYKVKDAYKLSDALITLLNKADVNIMHQATTDYSQFLYSTSNPLTSNNAFNNIFIVPKTNILTSEYDMPTRKAMITLKDIFDMLASLKLFWYIEDNKLKIEHAYWFNNGRSYSSNPNDEVDLLNIYDVKNNNDIIYGQNVVTYNNDKLSSRYEFGWYENVTSSFNGSPINMLASYTKTSKVEKIDIKNFVSDIDYMLYAPNEFSKDGFALLSTQFIANEYEVPFVSIDLEDENFEYSITLQNGYMSWFYLEKLYMYDLPCITINTDQKYVNGLIPVSTVKFMEHSVKIPNIDEIDLYSIIKTKIGNGTIDKISTDLSTKQTDLTLIYTAQ